MKKRAGLVFCLLVLTIVSVCAGFLFGFTAGVEENKNELFSSLAQNVAPAADSELFVRLFGKTDDGESEEPRLKTLFGSVCLSAGESFKNASFYPAELSLNAKGMKLNAASSDESVASASVLSCDENSVRVEITAKASGKAEVFLVDESGAVSSEKIRVSVAAAALSAEPTEPTEGETNVPSPAESEETSTVPETSTEPETAATEKETAEETEAETTENTTAESTEKVTENKKEKERKAQAAQAKATEKAAEKETKKDTKRPAATAGAKENGSLVYKTPSGSCYHRASCRYIKSGATSLTVKEAESRGLRACKVCKP